MAEIEVAGERLPMREALAEQIEVAWQRLAGPGTWWTGAERLAIAAACRRAETCDLCRRRKEALSPYGIEGVHDGPGDLPPPVVEAVHRLGSDAGRITEKWLRSLERGDYGTPILEETEYVEIVAVVAIVTALDSFDRSLGRPRRALPAPVAGTPTKRRPAGAKRDLAWVATLAPEDVSPEDPNPYPVHGDKNIHRGLSLVPQEVINFFDLDVELYLMDHEIRDFATEYRAISHAQIELIAGRASALNGCYY
jgi:hypothetical protein